MKKCHSLCQQRISITENKKREFYGIDMHLQKCLTLRVHIISALLSPLLLCVSKDLIVGYIAPQLYSAYAEWYSACAELYSTYAELYSLCELKSE